MYIKYVAATMMCICKKKTMIATTTPQANEQQEQGPLLLS
jgi:hypothetical protein